MEPCIDPQYLMQPAVHSGLENIPYSCEDGPYSYEELCGLFDGVLSSTDPLEGLLATGNTSNDNAVSGPAQHLPWSEGAVADQAQNWSAEPLCGLGEAMDGLTGQDLVGGMQYQQPLPDFEVQEMMAALQQSPVRAYDYVEAAMIGFGAGMPQLPVDLTTANMWQGGMPQPPMPPSASLPAVLAPGPPVGQPQHRQGGSRTAPRGVKAAQQCGECNFKSGHKDDFRRHVESVHRGIRRHRCDVCDVNINDPSGLSKHMRSAKHVANARRQGAQLPGKRYGCKFCSRRKGEHKSYARSDQLKRHLKTCRNCDHIGNEGLPLGYSSGNQGMDDGLLMPGQAWGFVSGPPHPASPL